MNAQEMFEEIGFLPPEQKLFSFRNGHVISYFKITVEKAVQRVERVFFYIPEKDYRVNSFTRLIKKPTIYCNKFYYKTSIKLHQAIHQQMKELGWLDE